MHTQQRVVQSSRVRRVVLSRRGIAVAIACAATLTACGGGGGGSSPSPSSAAQPPTSTPPKPVASVAIEAYGDSTTLGLELVNGASTVTAHSEPFYLQALLQSQFGESVTVSNQGVSGTEVYQLLNGTDGKHPTWANQMASSKAQIVTVNFALNDAHYSVSPTAHAPAETPTEYATAMTQIVQIAQSYGKTVVIFEPNPTCDPEREPILPAYVQALRGVAHDQGVQIVAEYDPILALPNWQARLTDCLHPDDMLYATKAQYEATVLASIIRAKIDEKS